MKKLFVTLTIIVSGFFLTQKALSQNVSINDNGVAPNTNAILDIDISTNNKGLLIPRLTSAERTAISLGVGDEGLTVYDETTNSYWLWDGGAWSRFTTGNQGWLLEGNSGVNPANDFLGTADANDLVFRTNNTERARFLSTGNFGIGTTNPQQILHIANALPYVRFTDTDGGHHWYFGADGGDTRFLIGEFDPAGAGTYYNYRFSIKEGGYTGIGTYQPEGLLHIKADPTFDATLLIDADGGTGNEDTWKLTSAVSDNDLNIINHTNTRLTIEADGDIGIGTSSPQKVLHIANSVPYIRLDDTDGGNFFEIGNSGGEFRIYENATERFEIEVGGNVGIGTSNPAYLLDVNGNANITTDLNVVGDAYLNGGSIIGDAAADIILVGGTSTFYEPVTIGDNGGTDGQLILYSEQGATDYTLSFNPNAAMTQNVALTYPADDGTIGQVLTTDGSGNLSWSNAGGSGDFSNNGDNAGANRTIGNNDNFALGIETNGTTRIHIENSGNVGIGTDNPDAKLHVILAGTPLTQYAGTVAAFQQNNAVGDWARISIVGGNAGASIIDFADADLQNNGTLKYDHTNNFLSYNYYDGSTETEILRIEDYGYVGIRTNNPTEILDVNGAVRIGNTTNTNAGAIRWSGTNFEGYDGSNWVSLTASGGNWTLSGSNIYRNTGNVGIGVVAPAEKLDIVGNLKLSGTANVGTEVNRTAQGTADLIPIAYGVVSSTGTITNAGTGNWSVTSSSTGIYDITITSETYISDNYMTQITPRYLNTSTGANYVRAASFGDNGGKLRIHIKDGVGTFSNTTFHFIVYKQ